MFHQVLPVDLSSGTFFISISVYPSSKNSSSKSMCSVRFAVRFDMVMLDIELKSSIESTMLVFVPHSSHINFISTFPVPVPLYRSYFDSDKFTMELSVVADVSCQSAGIFSSSEVMLNELEVVA